VVLDHVHEQIHTTITQIVLAQVHLGDVLVASQDANQLSGRV